MNYITCFLSSLEPRLYFGGGGGTTQSAPPAAPPPPAPPAPAKATQSARSLITNFTPRKGVGSTMLTKLPSQNYGGSVKPPGGTILGSGIYG